jgi:hypothetical protein
MLGDRSLMLRLPEPERAVWIHSLGHVRKCLATIPDLSKSKRSFRVSGALLRCIQIGRRTAELNTWSPAPTPYPQCPRALMADGDS